MTETARFLRYIVYLLIAVGAAWAQTFGQGLSTVDFQCSALIVLVCIGFGVEDGR